MAWPCVVGQGSLWIGLARRGAARFGLATLCAAMLGQAGQGLAWCGMDWQGKARLFKFKTRKNIKVGSG